MTYLTNDNCHEIQNAYILLSKFFVNRVKTFQCHNLFHTKILLNIAYRMINYVCKLPFYEYHLNHTFFQLHLTNRVIVTVFFRCKNHHQYIYTIDTPNQASFLLPLFRYWFYLFRCRCNKLSSCTKQ